VTAAPPGANQIYGRAEKQDPNRTKKHRRRGALRKASFSLLTPILQFILYP